MSTPTPNYNTPGHEKQGSRVPRRPSAPALNSKVDVPRQGNRPYLLGTGAVLLSLVAVGFLLLNDRSSVANTTAISAESDKSIALTSSPVTVQGSSSTNHSSINPSSANNGEVTTQHADSKQVQEQFDDHSPDVELISSYEDQIQELLLENDELHENLESAIEENDYLREETLQLNEELLRLELALFKASEAAKGPVEVRTVYNITNVPAGSFIPKVGRATESIESASTSVETEPKVNLAKQVNSETNDDQTGNTVDYLGASGELEIEVRYEDASPADQLAYDEYINDHGQEISYAEFRFSSRYKPADVN